MIEVIEMNSKPVHYDIEGYSLFEKTITPIPSVIVGFFKKIQAEQVNAIQQLNEKRQILDEYYQESIDRLPLEDRLKLGSHRF